MMSVRKTTGGIANYDLERLQHKKAQSAAKESKEKMWKPGAEFVPTAAARTAFMEATAARQTHQLATYLDRPNTPFADRLRDVLLKRVASNIAAEDVGSGGDVASPTRLQRQPPQASTAKIAEAARKQHDILTRVHALESRMRKTRTLHGLPGTDVGFSGTLPSHLTGRGGGRGGGGGEEGATLGPSPSKRSSPRRAALKDYVVSLHDELEERGSGSSSSSPMAASLRGKGGGRTRGGGGGGDRSSESGGAPSSRASSDDESPNSLQEVQAWGNSFSAAAGPGGVLASSSSGSGISNRTGGGGVGGGNTARTRRSTVRGGAAAASVGEDSEEDVGNDGHHAHSHHHHQQQPPTASSSRKEHVPPSEWVRPWRDAAEEQGGLISPMEYKHQVKSGRAYDGFGDYNEFSHSFRDRNVGKEVGPGHISTSHTADPRRAFRRPGEIDLATTALIDAENEARGYRKHPFLWPHNRVVAPDEPFQEGPLKDLDAMPVHGEKEKRAKALASPRMALPREAEPLRVDKPWSAWSTAVIEKKQETSSSMRLPPLLTSPMRTTTIGTGTISGGTKEQDKYVEKMRTFRGPDAASTLRPGAGAVPSGSAAFNIDITSFAKTGVDPLAVAAAERDPILASSLSLNKSAKKLVLAHYYADPVKGDEFSQSLFRNGTAWDRRLAQYDGKYSPLKGIVGAPPSLPPPGQGDIAATPGVPIGSIEEAFKKVITHSALAAALHPQALARGSGSSSSGSGRFVPYSQQGGGWGYTKGVA